jgi:tyrosyl-tRNA synthetase
MPDAFAELEWRGFVQQATPDVQAHLAGGRRTAYCGFDPTAPSLQLGNLMPIMLLRHLQLGGHRPIVLMGGGTGMIGDPSGKKNERPLLSKEQIRQNLHHQRDQMSRLLDFDSKDTRPLVLDNADWLEQQTLVAFLRDIGKHFTVNLMLQKESVQARLDAGISYTEFSYMLLQAYDFLHLFRKEHCTLQVGGSDQWGNITAGVDLIRRVDSGEAHGLVAPLVTTASGAKFGKTEAGAIWLDPALTSPDTFNQFWVNTDDRDVERYLKFFTLKTAGDIQSLMSQHTGDPAARHAQRALAYDVTSLVHGEEAAAGVAASAQRLFGTIRGSSGIAVDAPTLKGEGLVWNPHDPNKDISASEKPDTVVGALVRSELAKSKGDARRLIEQGGVYLNGHRVTDVEQRLRPEDWAIDGKRMLLRKGKKTFRWLSVVN